jgi:hypothetical protein
LQKSAEAAVRGGKMARRENCVQCVVTTAANQPTAADYCCQCGMSIDMEGVATVDKDVPVLAMIKALYERCNSQFPQSGRTAATTTFKSGLSLPNMCDVDMRKLLLVESIQFMQT